MKSVVFFDLGNLFAECRLGNVQSVGSPREVQFLGHGHEVPKVPEMGIHSQQLSQLVLDAQLAGS